MSTLLTGLIIGTVIMFVLDIVAVRPLAGLLFKGKLSRPEYAHLLQEPLDESGKKELQSLATPYYIIADIAIMGIAGLLMGVFFGLFFVGFSTKLAGWPGMITFIGASLLGCFMLG